MQRTLLNKTKIMAAFALALYFCSALWPHTAQADAPPNTAMPQPDLITYGSVYLDGEAVVAGTVKVRLPRGDVVSVPIEAVDGTAYEYVVAVPLSAYAPTTDAANYASDSATAGEAIHFYINDRPALFKAANGTTVDKFVIPSMGMGSAQVLDLMVAGPDRFASGDVNANGVRDSADGMLVLKHDIGLIPGGEVFPPPPGMIYTPLCDIVEDGQCNSSDALRILRCDIGLTNVGCPAGLVQAASLYSMQLSDDADLALQFDATINPAQNATGGSITVRLLLADPATQFGAASLTIQYDSKLMALVSCTPPTDGKIEIGLCNPKYGNGFVRLNGVTSTTIDGETTLAELTFQLLDSASDPATMNAEAINALLSEQIRIVDGNMYDQQGLDIAWRIASNEPPSRPQQDDSTLENEQNASPTDATNHSVYMPLLSKGGDEESGNSNETDEASIEGNSGATNATDQQDTDRSDVKNHNPIEMDNRIYLPAIAGPSNETNE